MSFQTATMFAGDLLDAAARFAADMAAVGPAALPAAWAQARQMGWPTLLVPEAMGGPGGTLADLGAVVEGTARHALALPLARRCAQAPALLMALGDAGAPTLRALCANDIDIDVPDSSGLRVTPAAGSHGTAAGSSGGVRVSGTLEMLDLSLPASHRLVVAGGFALLVPDALLPAPATRHVGIDGRRWADVQLDGLVLPASAVLARGPAVVVAAQAAADLAALATAIEMAATLGAMVEHDIAYLLQRQQFGTALATFQVLRHRVVELYVDHECACALLSRIVSDTLASGALSPRDAALAKLHLNPVARRSAEASMQLHGGMGMTAELPATRLARRLIVAEFDNGDRQQLLARLAALPQPMAADAGAAAAAEALPA